MSYQDFPPPRGPPPVQSPYILSREERRVLQECNSESFYRRCLPFMSVLGMGTYYGVHLGYLKKNVNYGAAPKVAVALVVGFIAGKFSYQKQCEEKILRLPGGKLKESVLNSRKRRDGGVWATLDDGGVYKDASISYAMPPYPERSYTSYDRPNSSSELDDDRPMNSFDDSFMSRSEFSDEAEQNIPNAPPTRSLSYDELRGQNREEYESRRKQFRSGPLDDYLPYSDSYNTASPPPSKLDFNDRVDKPEPHQNTYASGRVAAPRKNFYGDVIEK